VRPRANVTIDSVSPDLLAAIRGPTSKGEEISSYYKILKVTFIYEIWLANSQQNR